MIPSRATRRTTRAGRALRDEQTSDFDPDEEAEVPEDDHLSNSETSPNKDSQADLSSQQGRRSGRLAKKRASQRTSPRDSELDADEIAAEAADLRRGGGRSRRRRQSLDIAYDQPTLRRRAQVDYRVIRPETFQMDDDDAPAISAPGARPRKTGNAYRSLFSTAGPFGGTAGAAANLLGAPGAAGNADSDSSDDELSRATNKPLGGTVGMTPTAAAANNLFGMTTNNDAAQGGGPADLGRVKDRKAMADADPLGVDPNVNFDGVGGMEGHINQLKEMVLLPLLYPELFQTLHITPPRGVLFHGPPGTGKTLLARALASSVSMQGKKVTFYMRKGADALSKWVGEAERQLRLLFEEARKTQPSIIFFDEIDGLAPVRSSKQEQIHASIVATLLALMDGMDGRGQVIVIGATNRPDSVDPALRRPGRFDREFYFPLPNEIGRRAIIDIHTKGWEPALQPAFKDQLANLTKGYGGADLRALCTEAALNAIQGTYPQIYQSDDKLLVDPKQIKVLAKDFMISVQKMIPSSERSAPSGAAPLESSVEPLLRDALTKITTLLDDVLPERKKLTALEEAEFDDRDEFGGFEREMIQQRFDSARIFRPRLLVYGAQGMGQSYIGKAILHKFERLHVQSLDVANLLSDSTRVCLFSKSS
jgi:SpoVK/Ycf46/Vps4 family AAA+-type ATPase